MVGVDVKSTVAWAALASAFALPAAFAQDDVEQPAEETGVEEIVVTGSRLVRRDFSSPSPIVTIGRERLDFAGQATLESTLNQMPQIVPDEDRSVNNGGDGKARINLRGMGANRTLVMLNGRRLAPSGIGTAVDINNLPQVLVERTEVITGGATTVYGSDAVAGVVNFVLRDDFEGLSIDLSGYSTEQGDANAYDVSIAYGHNFSDARGNITVYGGYYDRDELFASARPYTATQWADNWDGTLSARGSVVVPEGFIFFPPIDFGEGPVSPTIFGPGGTLRPFADPDDNYNFQPSNYIQVPLERYSGGVFLDYELGSTELYVEASYAENRAERSLAPVPAGTFLMLSTDSPFLPDETRQLLNDFLFPVAPDVVAGFMGKRFTGLGPRVIINTSEYKRLVAGIRGDLGSDWEFDAWATYTKNDEETVQRNDGSISRLQQGLLYDADTGGCTDPSNGCVPLNIFGLDSLTGEMLDFIRFQPLVNVTDREQLLVSAFVRGELFRTWAGPVATAFGAEWRRDDGSFRADDALFEFDTLGYRPRERVDGSESVVELYAEALVPLLDGARLADYVALEIGGRYSDYEHAGSVTTYKAGLEWQIVSGLRFRGMFQRSVRAPNLLEAFVEQQRFTNFLIGDDPRDDPCSASANPAASGVAEQCIATGLPADQLGVFEASVFPVEFVTGGNPDLEPEVAETLTAGFVLEPFEAADFQLAVDYFRLELEDSIGGLDAIDACYDPANSGALFCDALSRDPATYNINSVFQPNINRGLIRSEGVDTQLVYRTELPDSLVLGGGAADLSASVAWTHMNQSSFQQTPFSTSLQCAGFFGMPCTEDGVGARTFAGDRVTTNLNYVSGDFSALLTWRWISGTRNATVKNPAFINTPGAELAVPRVGHENYLDFGAGYSFTDNVTARLAIANLTDKQPPLMTASAMGVSNVDQSMYDVYGRAYTLSLSLSY